MLTGDSNELLYDYNTFILIILLGIFGGPSNYGP
ncbi:MAG: hypothetical protein CM15mV103_350 [uncultured marine virus]|nr:MAG: hypothetical protein CM15mV103_350 [uncultured marine virus]